MLLKVWKQLSQAKNEWKRIEKHYSSLLTESRLEYIEEEELVNDTDELLEVNI